MVLANVYGKEMKRMNSPIIYMSSDVFNGFPENCPLEQFWDSCVASMAGQAPAVLGPGVDDQRLVLAWRQSHKR
jgi:hypothetical protein